MNVKVFLWGELVGVLYYDEISNECLFQYDADFIKKGVQISPIIMPLSNKTFNFGCRIPSNFGLPPLLRESLPDTYGNALIDAYLTSIGSSETSLNPAKRLCYVGSRGMGALEFKPETYHERKEKIEIEQLIELSSLILNKKKQFKTNDIYELINVSTSAGGRRAKAIVQYNFETREFRSGQIDAEPGFDYFLIKFDIMDSEQFYTRIEYAYYLMCKDCSINISDSYLFGINDKYHFLTKRFDREIINGKTHKLHMQSLAALENLDYEKPGSYSYEQLNQLFDELDISSEKEEMYRRIIFNCIGRNQDDHVKNISFLMDKDGCWHLSPAYDMCYAYNEKGMFCNAHQMLINGKNKDFTLDDLLLLGKAFNLKKDKCLKIIDNIERVFINFDKYAHKAKLPKNVVKRIYNDFQFVLNK